MPASPPDLPASRPSLLDALAHAALERACAAHVRVGGPPPLLVDATLGNGHDAAFLLGCAPPDALLLAVDVQARAIETARPRLAAVQAARQRQDVAVQIFCRGHEELPRIRAELPACDRQRPLLGAMFNLGWLPGGDKSCLTRTPATLAALDFLLHLLMPQGCISLHCYTGHDGGADEEAAVLRRVAELPPRRWRVAHCRDANRESGAGRAESVILVERLPLSRREGTAC